MREGSRQTHGQEVQIEARKNKRRAYERNERWERANEIKRGIGIKTRAGKGRE